jgi:hypothetical protein
MFPTRYLSPALLAAILSACDDPVVEDEGAQPDFKTASRPDWVGEDCPDAGYRQRWHASCGTPRNSDGGATE